MGYAWIAKPSKWHRGHGTKKRRLLGGQDDDLANDGEGREYLRGSCCEGRHPGLEHAPPEAKRVLAYNDQVNQGEDGELVEEDSGDYGDDEHCQLGHNESKIGYAQDLGANDTTDTNRRNPEKIDSFLTKNRFQVKVDPR